MSTDTKLGTKICTKCGGRKTLEEFSPSIEGVRGRNSWCKACIAEHKQGQRGIRARDIEPVRRDPLASKRDRGLDNHGLEMAVGGSALRTGLGPKRAPVPNKSTGLAAQIAPIPCPCCARPVAVPALDVIVFHYSVKPQEERIFRAVWAGRGLPVSAEKIFDAMYADDPDGGPGPAKMYAAFKESLHRLRRRLDGSGIAIVNSGYRSGYRLVMGVAQKET